MVFTPQDKELIQQRLDTPPVTTHKLFLVDVTQGTYLGRDVAMVGPMLGAPQAVLTLDKLIALGVRRVIALGWCGSLQPDVRIGDVVLPTGSHSEEGTSCHYPLPTGMVPGPSEELLSAMANVLTRRAGVLAGGQPKEEGSRVHHGMVWSIDAPYRETVDKVLRYQREGILAVDMETSALFTVARYRSIDLAGILVVSDELSTLRWIHGFKEPRFLRTRQWVARCVLDTLVGESVSR
jgi:uridine phosphorylase